MDTQHLRAFITVARFASFTEAAERLHITQPAVSKRIATLESNLCCQLFDRIGRRVALTEAGKALLPRAEHILQTVMDTEQALTNLAGEVRGPLKLATSHHIGLHHLPKILKPYALMYPQVKLELDFIDSEQAPEALQRGDIELALVTLSPDKANRDNMNYVSLWHDPLDIVVAVDHPLTRHPQITLSDLADYPAILPALTTHTTELIQRLFRQAGISVEISMTTNYLETIKMMVSIGLGWSALPHTISRDSHSTDLTILSVEGAQLSRTLGCVLHADRTLSNAANRFLRALQQSAHPDDKSI